MHDCGFQKNRDVESFIILNFVVLYSIVYSSVLYVVTMSLDTRLSIVYI